MIKTQFKKPFKIITPKNQTDDAIIAWAKDSLSDKEKIDGKDKWFVSQYQYHILLNLWWVLLHFSWKSKKFKKYWEKQP